MAKDKNSFIAYSDWIDIFEELEDDEAGRLAKHLFRYVNDKNPQTSDRVVNISFITIKNTLKRDLVKYESIVERNKKNGEKGGRPKKPTGLSGLSGKPKKADSDSDNVSDSVNENEIKEIYKHYPSKCPVNNSSTGKTSSNKSKIKQLLKNHSKKYLIDLIDWYVQDCKKSNRFIKNFGTFLNNLPEIPKENDQDINISKKEIIKKPKW